MTDGGSSVPRNASQGSHFVVTCVEQSTQDGSDAEEGDHPSTSSSAKPDLTMTRGRVVFKIGDSTVFGDSRPSSVGKCEAVIPPLPVAAPLLQSHSSRFHIVKLENNPYRRGRWLCKDKEEPKMLADLPVRQSITVHFVSADVEQPAASTLDEPFGKLASSAVESASGAPEPLSSDDQVVSRHVVASSPLVDAVTTLGGKADSVQISACSHNEVAPIVLIVNGQEQVAGAKTTLHSLRPQPGSSIDSVVEQLSADQIFKDFESHTAAGAGTSPDSGATSSDVAIDNKIEQAMDLVKTHLLYAVREEVDLFKERIEKLERVSRRLEAENKLLRDHATPDVLAKLGPLLSSKGLGNAPSATVGSSAIVASASASNVVTSRANGQPQEHGTTASFTAALSNATSEKES